MTLIDQYRDALALQSTLQQQEFEEQASLPIADRVLKGHSMINLVVDFDFYEVEPDPYCSPLPEGMAYVKSAHVGTWDNVSGFREGSSVWLSRGQYRLKMEVIQDTVRHFVLQPNQYERQQCVLPTKGVSRFGWQVDEAENTATSQMLLTVADYLHQNPDKAAQIADLLEGTYSDSYRTQMALTCCDGLNASQREAVEKSLSTDFIHLIQGPPGTGKTHTIARLCQELVERGCSVMVSGPTHTAINNCLDHTARLLQDPSKVVKLGERYQATEILENQYVTRKTRLRSTDYRSDRLLSHDGIVVGATPYALCYPKSKKLDGWVFDYAVVDEASQMSIPMALSVMAKCHRVIFVGDHQQLSPIIPSSDHKMFQSSIFEFLVHHYPQSLTLLDISYRLNAELLHVPNQLFYGGLLHSEVPIAKPFLSLKGYSAHSQVLTGSEGSLLYLHDEFDGIGHSPYEAGVVADVVSDLLSNGIPLSQIGILTPFRAQVREIRRAVYERGILNEKRIQELFVDTVDRMQGQERDYVLYSTADCNPLEHNDRLGFIYDYHRLNVALTRAKVKCIVIANSKIFSIAQELLKEESDVPKSSALKEGLEAFVRFEELSQKLHFDPLDDSDIWM